MNQAIKQRLIQALESGFYTQTRTNLKDEFGYCAFGVLCDLYSMETGIPWRIEYIMGYPYYSFLGMSTVLPETVKEWVKMRYEDEDKIMSFNDSCDTFSGVISYLKEVC